MKKFLGVLVLLLGVASLGFGQGLGFKGVGGGLGFITASMDNGNGTSSSLSGFLIGAHADLGEITKDISLVPDITYWSASKDPLKLSDFSINANAHYNIAVQGQFKPYVGAGLGYNSFTSTVTIPSVTVFGFTVGGGTASASASRLGINLLAGANYKLNDMLTLLVEPRYVLASDFNHFTVKVGVTYALK
ncbi:MAG: outer membrane beta-barrel protein [Bacteroidota bacterium]|jgi:outer membrane protein